MKTDAINIERFPTNSRHFAHTRWDAIPVLAALFSWTGNKNFRDRMRLVQWLEIRTVTEGWKDGLGPSEKPYWMCCTEELLGERVATVIASA
jgi:hypothetical protein